MAGRLGNNYAATAARRLLLGVGAGAGAFVAAAAMATGSATPAHADFEDLLDPVLQPLLTSLTDSVAVLDPAAALESASWADNLLASLNASFESLLPSATDSAAAAAAVAAASDPITGTYDIPLRVLEGTEPAVNASVDGGSAVSLLVDTGSSGLVIPYTDLGSNYFSQLEALFSLGTPTGISESGYSGGVEYIYLTYNSVPVDYLNADGTDALSTSGPVDVEIYSWNPSNLFSLVTNDAFQNFLSNNEVDGILGVGMNTAGPTTSPFIDYGGVYVNIPGNELVVTGTNPIPEAVSTSGSPVATVLESVNNGTPVQVSNNIDSGGVFGTIPSSLAPSGSVPEGTLISVFNTDHELLYSYTTTNSFDVSDTSTPHLVSDAPTVVSGNSIDSGVLPFLTHGVYIDYAADKTYFEPLSS